MNNKGVKSNKLHKLKKLNIGKKRNSLRLIIGISFIVLMLGTVTSISTIIFSNWKASVDETITIVKGDTNQDILNQIDAFINIPLNTNDINHHIIQNKILDIQDKNKREAFLVGAISSSDDMIYSFTYGMENGYFYGARKTEANEIELYRSDDETSGHSWYYSVTDDLTAGEFIADFGEFDPRTRDWYIIGKQEGRPTFSPVYTHFVKRDLALSAAHPIYDQGGNLKGVLASHITLSRLNNYLEEIAGSRNAITYIIDTSSGEVVANSLKVPNFEVQGDNQFKRISIEEIENQAIIEAYRHFIETSEYDFRIKAEEENYHFHLVEYSKAGLNWLVITAIPESFFTAEINKNIRTALYLSILALILSLLIYMKSINNILKPINSLIETAEGFSNGELQQRAKVYRNDEIGKLSETFNTMADELCLHIDKLEEKVQERTMELELKNSRLTESEEDIRILLDSTAEGIYGMDMEGNCTFCNKSALEMLGYKDQDELIGKNMHSMIHYKTIDGKHLKEGECKIFKAFMKGVGTTEKDEVFWRVDGSFFPVEYFSYPQFHNGEIIGAVVTFMDITERKKAENELIKAKEEAESANIAKSQFLANMSHEIRTPMNGIFGFIQLLEDTKLNDHQRDFVNTIKTSTEALLNILNDILDISKIEAGNMELEHIPFDIRTLIEKTVMLYDAKAQEKGLELNMLISSAIPQLVIGDPTKLRQVISNLISNAVKFTDQGEVFIEVTISKNMDKDVELQFEVKDTGIGISPKEKDKLFKPFSQGDASSTRKYGGTGWPRPCHL